MIRCYVKKPNKVFQHDLVVSAAIIIIIIIMFVVRLNVIVNGINLALF